MIFFIEAFGLLLFSVLVWTLGEILSATNPNVYIANHTPSSHRGRFNSILPLILQVGFALNPLLMGRYIEVYSLQNVWPLAAALAVAGAVSLLLLGALETYMWRGRVATPGATAFVQSATRPEAPPADHR
ncbi:MAG: hypothetical protein ACQETQ_13480 [Spirochaetota bacterium]